MARGAESRPLRPALVCLVLHLILLINLFKLASRTPSPQCRKRTFKKQTWHALGLAPALSSTEIAALFPRKAARAIALHPLWSRASTSTSPSSVKVRAAWRHRVARVCRERGAGRRRAPVAVPIFEFHSSSVSTDRKQALHLCPLVEYGPACPEFGVKTKWKCKHEAERISAWIPKEIVQIFCRSNPLTVTARFHLRFQAGRSTRPPTLRRRLRCVLQLLCARRVRESPRARSAALWIRAALALAAR